MKNTAPAGSARMRLYPLVTLVLVLVLTACGRQPLPEEPSGKEPIIPETTHVVDAGTRQSLLDYDPVSGELRFAASSPLLDGLQPDDVLVSVPSEAAPDGYLRKVRSVRTEGSEVIVATTQANLTDAIHQGSLDEEFELGAEDLVEATSHLAGVSIGLRPQDITGELPFRLSFDETVLDTGSGATRSTVRVNGSVDFSVRAGVGLDISGCWDLPPVCLDRFAAWVGFQQAAALEISGSAQTTLSTEVKIGELRFSPLCFYIGPVPVCFVPTAYVHLGMNGEVNLSFDYAVRQEATATLGAEYRDGGWHSLGESPTLTTETTRPFTVNAGLAASAWLKGEVGMMLYGVAGPHIGVKLGIRLDAETGRDPFWQLTGSLSGYYGLIVDLPVLGRLVDHSRNLFDISTDAARSQNSPPVVRVVSSAHTIALGETFNLSFHVSDGICSGHYCIFDPEDGLIDFVLESDVDGVLTPAQHMFATPGIRTLTFSGQDSKGASSTGSFTVNVVNTPPAVFGSASSDTVPATVPYYISAAVTDPNSDMTCADLQWQVTAPDIFTRMDLDERNCYGQVIFGAEGARTVTLSATDPHGASSTPRQFAVTVTPAPANPPPEITSLFQVLGCIDQFPPCDEPIPEGSFAFGVLTLTVRAEDADGVTYSFFAQCQECVNSARLELGSNAMGDLVWTPPEYGMWTVGVTVSDGTSSIGLLRTVDYSVLIL